MATRGLNKLMLIGYLGRDPELRYTPAGKAVAHFSLAVGRVGRDQAGARTEETAWFRIVAWDHLAETCNDFLAKGSRIYLEGRLHSRKYTDKEGVERTIVEVIAHELVMLDGRRADDGEAAPAGQAEPATSDGEALPF